MSSRKNRLVLIFGAAILSAFSGAILADSHTLTAVKNWSTFKEEENWHAGDDLEIASGATLIYDGTGSADDRLGNLTVHGTFKCSSDYTANAVTKMQVEYVHLMGSGALFECGTETTPLSGRFELTTLESAACKALTQEQNAAADNCQGFMVMDGSRLHLFGSKGESSWTRVSANAAAGSSSISVDGAPAGWSDQDQIVIGSSIADPAYGLDTNHVDDANNKHITPDESNIQKRKISGSVSSNVVTLDAVLTQRVVGTRYEPAGAPVFDLDLDIPGGATTGDTVRDRQEAVINQLYSAGRIVLAEKNRLISLLSAKDNGSNKLVADQRVEVANLTRNIVFRGDPDSAVAAAGRGIHMMIMKHMGSSPQEVHVDGLEIINGGRSGQLARYPFHWHWQGNRSGDYIKNSSIHDSYNRCITVHATQNVLVENNVCYNTAGHAFFLEDGNETGVRLINNLAILAKPVDRDKALLDSDVEGTNLFVGPAGFWISNPYNVYINNVATSVGTGFWYALKDEERKLNAMVAKSELKTLGEQYQYDYSASNATFDLTMSGSTNSSNNKTVTINLTTVIPNLSDLIAAINAQLVAAGQHGLKAVVATEARGRYRLKFRAVTDNDNSSISVTNFGGAAGSGAPLYLSNSGSLTGTCSEAGTPNPCLAPVNTPMGIFAGNVAHNVALGVTFDGGPNGPCMDNPLFPCISSGRLGDFQVRQVNQHGNAEYLPGEDHALFINDFTVYDAMKFGSWIAARGAPTITNLSVSDSKIMVGQTLDQDTINALFVGATDGFDEDEYSTMLNASGGIAPMLGNAGLLLMYDGPVQLKNAHFAGYGDESMPGLIPLMQTGGAGKFVNTIEGVSFDISSESGVKVDFNGRFATTIYAKDNTLTGTAGETLLAEAEVFSWYQKKSGAPSGTAECSLANPQYLNSAICPGKFGLISPSHGYNTDYGYRVQRIAVNHDKYDDSVQSASSAYLPSVYQFPVSVDRKNDFKYRVEVVQDGLETDDDKFFTALVYQMPQDTWTSEIIFKHLYKACVPNVYTQDNNLYGLNDGADEVMSAPDGMHYQIKATRSHSELGFGIDQSLFWGEMPVVCGIDTDGDGVPNSMDSTAYVDDDDDDDDGVLDGDDYFPLNPFETQDTDGDDIGNNHDDDDDNDGLPDAEDTEPLVYYDKDGDGVPNVLEDSVDFETNRWASRDTDVDGLPDTLPFYDDFETGNFERMYWDINSDKWSVVNESGAFMARTAAINDDESAVIRLNNVVTGSKISFRVKTDTHAGDELHFYVDGREHGVVWSGATDTTVTIDIPPTDQKHNLEWLYHKNNDGLASEVDAVWIDNVSLNATSSLVEDADDDNDGLLDTADNCSLIANIDQANTDSDGYGDACDPRPADADNDGIADADEAAMGTTGTDTDSPPRLFMLLPPTYFSSSHKIVLAQNRDALYIWEHNLGAGTYGFLFSFAIHLVDINNGASVWGGSSKVDLDKAAFFLKDPLKLANKGAYSCGLGSNSDVICASKAAPLGPLPFRVKVAAMDVAVGVQKSCAIMLNGAVSCWRNIEGVNDDTIKPSIPSGYLAKAIAMGNEHACAIYSNGTLSGVSCAGDASDGKTTPPAVVSPLQITAGDNHTCVLDGSYASPASIQVKCWGRNDAGQLSVPSYIGSPVHIKALVDTTCVTQLAAGKGLANAIACWPDVIDTDQDSALDYVDADDDNDGVDDDFDIYPITQTGSENDPDRDGGPSECDVNCKGVGMAEDNCPDRINLRQADMDEDSFGDACDMDVNNDGIVNNLDYAFIFKNGGGRYVEIKPLDDVEAITVPVLDKNSEFRRGGAE